MNGQTSGRRYELSVSNFDIVAKGAPATPSAADDQIFEFGECCHVAHLALSNKSGPDRIPSPSHQRVRVRLEKNEWCLPTGEDAFCAKSISAGSTERLDDSIPFHIEFPPACSFRPAGTTTEFATQDLGPNPSFDFDPSMPI